MDKFKKVKAIYDNGSTCSIVNDKLVAMLKSKLITDNNIIQTINGVNFCTNRASLSLRIGEIEDTLNVIVVKNSDFKYNLLLGLDAIQKFKLIQDENLKIKQKLPNKIINIEDDTIDDNFKDDFINYMRNSPNLEIVEVTKMIDQSDSNKKKIITKILQKFKSSFAEHKFDVGSVKDVQATIKLKEDKYISKKPYRCSFPDQAEIDLQITKLLEKNLIEESSSPFASPVTLAFKKEEGRKSRLCIDYRELNKIIVPEAQPFPRIEDLVVLTSNSAWFTSLDINSAFWSIPLRPKDRTKTAFITQKGHWQWKVLPFGFKNSPAIFQRTLSGIIRRYNLSQICINYIDDILIFSKNLDEHFKHIELVLQALKKEGFKLKLSKCNFAKHSVKYLGHMIEKGKIYPIKDNVKAIKEFPRPTTRKMVRQLLGKINFYHKFIDHCTQRLNPLHNLLKKDEKFIWTNECENCFQQIKQYLCSTPILAIYDHEKEIVIEVDASRSGLGAVFKQPQHDGILHPVGYFSKKLTTGQMKKEITYLECLAIKEAVVYWQHYLIGRSFIVISDHKPLMNLKTKSRTDEALGDLMLYLSQYNFKIIYKEGKNNIEADTLSRNPVLEIFDNKDDVLKVVNMIQLADILDNQKTITDEINNSKNIINEGGINFKILKTRKRIYVSEEFGKQLIDKIHGYYGHIGSNQISNKLRPFYYFKNMDSMIHKFCKTCEICIKNKSRSSRAVGLLSKLGPPKYPYEIMSIDTIGGFTGNRSTKKYMHLLVDHHTRYAWILTSSSQGANDFIKLLEPITSRHTVKTLLVDQYSGLNSNKFKTYLKNNKIKLIFTSIDNPQSNGLNERLNQTLVNRIRCKMNDNNKHLPWTKLAESCVQEYNNTTHSITKYSPAYLLYGQKSEIVPSTLQTDNDLHRDRQQAIKNSEENFMKNKKRIDKNRQEYEFSEGEMVFVANGNKLNRNKLDEVRSGPFRIKRKISNTTYEVDCKKKRKEANLFHSSKLIPYSFFLRKKSLSPPEM